MSNVPYKLSTTFEARAAIAFWPAALEGLLKIREHSGPAGEFCTRCSPLANSHVLTHEYLSA